MVKTVLTSCSRRKHFSHLLSRYWHLLVLMPDLAILLVVYRATK